MRELLGPAASAELARELEKKERGNLAWWNERYIVEGPPPQPDPLARQVYANWNREVAQKIAAGRARKAARRAA